MTMLQSKKLQAVILIILIKQITIFSAIHHSLQRLCS
jgi:hypothetical protein